MLAITLPDDIEVWARGEVAAGRARDAGELVASALREHLGLISRHRALVEEAYLSAENSGAIDEVDADAALDSWIAEDLKAAS